MSKPDPITVILSLGSNLGKREKFIFHALEMLKLISEDSPKLSSIYDTPPIGPENQDRYLNMCISLKTRLSGIELLNYCKESEKKIGRRKTIKWGPREIDIDIIVYGREISNHPELIIPHPEISNRQFILVPWAEIDPEYVHPVSGKSVSEMLSECILKYGQDNIILHISSKEIHYAQIT